MEGEKFRVFDDSEFGSSEGRELDTHVSIDEFGDMLIIYRLHQFRVVWDFS